MNKTTLVLAHYYTSPQVQAIADFVGDSLDLSLKAKESKADRIVFAGVRFMAETAKIINPKAEVILPDSDSTCSLVTQVDNTFDSVRNSTPALYQKIINLKTKSNKTTVITYINSSIKLKTLSDIIVTSANVENIVSSEIAKGNKVFFTPDRNMGAYLKANNPEWNDKFDYWKDAVCEVHDRFKIVTLEYQMRQWSDGKKFLIAHPESPLPILHKADFVGSTKAMLSWVRNLTSPNATVYIATEIGLLHNMRVLRPDLIIKQAPTYSGCQCNSCPYMKMNTKVALENAIWFRGGVNINLDRELMDKARKPIERMMNYGI